MPPFIVAFLSQLRFRTLFVLTAVIFITDLLVPDMLPLVDEFLLAAATLLLASLKRPAPSPPDPQPPHAPD